MSRKRRNQQRDDSIFLKEKAVSAKTPNQKNYIKTIQNNKITFCVGPAGSGKTFIATSLAILGLLKGQYQKIVVTRPLVQAGENTGYLPGTIQDKLNPYIRPIYDELNKYIDLSDIEKLEQHGAIEIVPFAYMRGRNFHNSFIIADECQNATKEQLILLLTRFCSDSTMVLTGDFTQSDLSAKSQGALKSYLGRLKNIEGVGIVELTTADICRDPIVTRIIEALENEEVSPEDISSKP